MMRFIPPNYQHTKYCTEEEVDNSVLKLGIYQGCPQIPDKTQLFGNSLLVSVREVFSEEPRDDCECHEYVLWKKETYDKTYDSCVPQSYLDWRRGSCVSTARVNPNSGVLMARMLARNLRRGRGLGLVVAIISEGRAGGWERMESGNQNDPLR